MDTENFEINDAIEATKTAYEGLQDIGADEAVKSAAKGFFSFLKNKFTTKAAKENVDKLEQSLDDKQLNKLESNLENAVELKPDLLPELQAEVKRLNKTMKKHGKQTQGKSKVSLKGNNNIANVNNQNSTISINIGKKE